MVCSFRVLIILLYQNPMDFRYSSNKLKPPDHSHRLNYDDFNELFWESASLQWLKVHTDVPILSATSAVDLIDSLAKSKAPGNSVKTFVERRGYAQVRTTIDDHNASETPCQFHSMRFTCPLIAESS